MTATAQDPVAEISAMLADRIENLCAELLPNGREESGSWRVGSLDGEPGSSLSVKLRGNPGMWHDFATGEKGDALNLVKAVVARGDMAEALKWSREWLGVGNSTDARQRPAERAGPYTDKGAPKPSLGPIKAVYDYADESGERLFQSLRFEPAGGGKTFRQRTGPDQKSWSLDGVRLVPFLLPELIDAVALGHVVFVVEGEKDVLTLRDHGVPATTNPMGAGKWRPEFNKIFRDGDVVICGDNDDPGRNHVKLVASNLYGVAKRVRVLDLAQFWPDIGEGDDITDWLDRSGTAERLYAIIEQLPDWQRPNGEDQAPAEPTKWSPDDLLISAWLERELPPREFLLGNVFCTTSRWLIFGDTGIGKTLFAMDMAGAMASANNFLGWEGGKRPVRVMYLDGEMPAETFKERMKLVAFLYGKDIVLYGYNRDLLMSLQPNGSPMPPLDTEEGEKWLWREINAVKPDVTIFDSIMCLLSGTMGEEESSASVKLLIRKITSRRIAQIWLHHTGHDTSKGFGTKTREWEMEAVVSLTKTEGTAILMEFKKARLRTPQSADQFKPRTIERNENGWDATGDEASKTKTAGKSEIEIIKAALLDAYDQLADNRENSPGFDGKPVMKVSVEKLREELKDRGFLETKDSGGLTNRARTYFNRAKTELLSPPKPSLFEKEGHLWK
jgi:hypothetical protein